MIEPELLSTEPAPKRKKPRIWPVILFVLAVFTVVHIVTSVVMVAYVTFADTEGSLSQQIFKALETSTGLLTAIVTAQATLLLLVLPAARLSREPFAQRLGLTAGSYEPWHLLVYMVATPAMGMIGYAYVVAIFGDVGETMEAMQQTILNLSLSMYLLMLVAITVLPAFAEEFVFRGYIQKRLIQRWGAITGITIASILFAAFHIDLHHALMVLPIGLWLGVVAWRTGSIIPAILCHGYNNLLATLLARFANGDLFNAPLAPGNLVIIAISVAALIVSIGPLRKTISPNHPAPAYDGA